MEFNGFANADLPDCSMVPVVSNSFVGLTHSSYLSMSTSSLLSCRTQQKCIAGVAEVDLHSLHLMWPSGVRGSRSHNMITLLEHKV